MLRRFALATLVACASDPPPPAVVVPPQPPPVAEAPPPPPPPPSTPRAAEPVEKPESPLEGFVREATKQSSCPDFDYFPGGGIQNLWCHRPARMTLESVAQLAGVDIFKSGPHSKTDLKLDSTSDFGHYNPEFVKWLVDKAAPSAHGTTAQRMTQSGYDRTLKPLATIFWVTLQKVKAEPECFNREKDAYAKLIASKRVPKDYYERWFYFMNPKFCAKAKTGLGPNNGFDYFYKNGMDADVDGNVTKSVVGFWLRRSMDGTMDTFAEGVTKLIATYQPALKN